LKVHDLVAILVRPSMTETTALGAAVAAGAAEGIALWDIKTKKESSGVSIFQPKLDECGKNFTSLKIYHSCLLSNVYNITYFSFSPQHLSSFSNYISVC
jgi:hypothetical protein